MAALSLPASLGSAANLNSHLKEAESNDQALKPMLNIGLYGWDLSLVGEFVKANRDLKRRFRELGGVEWLYAQTYYGEEVSRTSTTENVTRNMVAKRLRQGQGERQRRLTGSWNKPSFQSGKHVAFQWVQRHQEGDR